MKHNKSLDGLRGVAIIAVMFSHSPFLFFNYPNIKVRYAPWVGGGAFGVDLFFVLSGYLITTRLIDMRSTTGVLSLRTFYINRATRLLPALYFMLFIFVVVSVLDGYTFASLFPSIASAVFYYLNIKSSIYHDVVFHLLHLWSLSLEEQFYLLWPFAVVTLMRRSIRTTAALIIAVFVCTGVWRSLVVHSEGFQRFAWTDLRIDGLLVGALLAFTVPSTPLSPRIARLCGAIGAVVVMAHMLCTSVAEPYMWWGGFSVFYIGAGLLVASLVSGTSLMHSVLSWRPLASIGRVSYGIYLWHPIVWNYLVRHSAHFALPVLIACAIGLTAAMTLLSWFLVEVPAMKLRPSFVGMRGGTRR